MLKDDGAVKFDIKIHRYFYMNDNCFVADLRFLAERRMNWFLRCFFF